MGRRTREEEAATVEEQGGPPGTIPTGINDVEAIRKRWLEIFRYDIQTGAILWRYELDAHLSGQVLRCYEDLVATRSLRDGNYVYCDNLRVSAARFVWFIEHGEWPPGPLRRRDGDVFNDRIENLYVPDGMRSSRNTIRGRPRFRPVGVTRFYDRWRAYVETPNGRRVIGAYATMEEAAEARRRHDESIDLV